MARSPSRRPMTAMLNTPGRRRGSPRRRAPARGPTGDARERAVAAEVLLDLVAAEPVDAGRHGRVRGEHRGGADGLERLVEASGRSPISSRIRSRPRKPGVALVGVEDLRRRGAGQPRPQPQRADAADAEQQLLLQPVLAAAAVEAVGDACGRASSFSGTSESSSSSGTRPTSAFHTCACSARPPGSATLDQRRACRPPRAGASAAGRRGRAPGRSRPASRRATATA